MKYNSSKHERHYQEPLLSFVISTCHGKGGLGVVSVTLCVCVCMEGGEYLVLVF